MKTSSSDSNKYIHAHTFLNLATPPRIARARVTVVISQPDRRLPQNNGMSTSAPLPVERVSHEIQVI